MDSPKILLADDHEEFLKLYKTILERNSFSVVEAHNGEEAFHVAERERPHLAILDVEMPKKDGLSVMRDIRLSSWGTNMPVIIFTGKDADELRLKEIARWQPAYYLMKGKATPNDLIVKIHGLLKTS